jgi:hypothetical protein
MDWVERYCYDCCQDKDNCPDCYQDNEDYPPTLYRSPDYYERHEDR